MLDTPLQLINSFYPIFPVPQSISYEVNLDVSHSGLLKLGRYDGVNSTFAPDLLVLPSRLKQFSKVCLLCQSDHILCFAEAY